MTRIPQDVARTSTLRRTDVRETSTTTGTGTGTRTTSWLRSDPCNSPPSTPLLGGAGGGERESGEYEGIALHPFDRSSDAVPGKAWNKLKYAIDAAGLRMEFQDDYRAEADRLHAAFGIPLRASHCTAGYDAEIALFKRWHLRIHGSPPTRWPWQDLESTP